VPATAPAADVGPARLAITLPVPPSINHQYATVNGRRVLSAGGRDYKIQVGHQVLLALAGSTHRQTLLEAVRSSDLSLSLHFFFPSALRRDLDGGLKITQDALAEALGINDARIVELHLFKTVSDRPRVEAALSTAARP